MACAPAIRGVPLNATNPARNADSPPTATSAREAWALASNTTRCGDNGESPALYFNLPYGSEATFNPVSQILNEGFDYWQLAGQDKRIESVDYRGALRMIGRSVAHPARSVQTYGESSWIREEILPIGKSGAWIPNYQLHFLGSGMQSARLTQWYAQRGAPRPRALAAVTMMSSHVLNEIIELRTDYGYSGASMVDLLLFDVGGIAAFQAKRMQRFACRLRMTAWQGTPSYSPRTKTVENAQQYFVARWSPRDSAKWMAFAYMGMGNLVGVSRRSADGRALTIAAGATGDRSVNIDAAAGTSTVALQPQAGIFIDRANSLLLSALYSPSHSRGFELQLYPGVIGTESWSPSLWLRAPRTGGASLGIAFHGLPGLTLSR